MRFFYKIAQPAIHIGFLDYTLFEESPEFYATYKLINVKNHDIYNDNFTLSVVNLSRIDLATEEDKKANKFAFLIPCPSKDGLVYNVKISD